MTRLNRTEIPVVKTREDALRVTARSAVHAMCDWMKAGGVDRRDAFIAFWAAR